MTQLPSWFDYILVLVMFAFMAAEVFLFRALIRATPNGVIGDMRLRVYTFFIIYQWTLVACIAILWVAGGRQWSALLLGAPSRFGFAICLTLAVAYSILATAQIKAIAARPQVLHRLRSKIADLEGILPHTLSERRVWPLAAITAGCCEEVFFRGYLLMFFTNFAGLIAAVAICAILFGLFHAYYGPKGIAKTGAFGLLMTVMALWSSSLIPVIVIHAAVDLASGDVGYLILAEARETS